MACFQIRWRNPAEKELRRIDPQAIPVIVERIGDLAEDPFPLQSAKLKDRGNQRRLRIGTYRVLYEVDVEDKIIWIAAVGHRSGVYR